MSLQIGSFTVSQTFREEPKGTSTSAILCLQFFHLTCLQTLMNVLKQHPSNVASCSWNTEAPGALWNNRLAWTIWSCLLACKLPEVQSVIVIPVILNLLAGFVLFRMLAMAGEDLRNMQKLILKFLHELCGTWTAPCLAFGLNFVLLT